MICARGRARALQVYQQTTLALACRRALSYARERPRAAPFDRYQVLEQISLDMKEKTYLLNEQVGFLMRLANQRHSSIFQELVPHGLTATQFAAVVKLAEIGECSQNELGRQTAMDVATIKGVIERLKRKDMVTIQADPNDKRRSLLSLTAAAKGIISELHDAGQAITRLTLSPLSAAEQKTLLRLLDKLA